MYKTMNSESVLTSKSSVANFTTMWLLAGVQYAMGREMFSASKTCTAHITNMCAAGMYFAMFSEGKFQSKRFVTYITNMGLFTSMR